jgi:hypothetical protein
VQLTCVANFPSLSGVVDESEQTHQCLGTHCGKYRTTVQSNYWIDEDGNFCYWNNDIDGFNRQSFWSRVLKKVVFVPTFLRVGNNFVSWKYMLSVGPTIAAGSLSYSQAVEIYKVTNSPNNSVSWLTGDYLRKAHWLWRTLCFNWVVKGWNNITHSSYDERELRAVRNDLKAEMKEWKRLINLEHQCDTYGCGGGLPNGNRYYMLCGDGICSLTSQVCAAFPCMQTNTWTMWRRSAREKQTKVLWCTHAVWAQVLCLYRGKHGENILHWRCAGAKHRH